MVIPPSSLAKSESPVAGHEVGPATAPKARWVDVGAGGGHDGRATEKATAPVGGETEAVGGLCTALFGTQPSKLKN